MSHTFALHTLSLSLFQSPYLLLTPQSQTSKMSSTANSNRDQAADVPVTMLVQGNDAENPVPLGLSVNSARLPARPTVRNVRFADDVAEFPRVVFLEPPSGSS